MLDADSASCRDGVIFMPQKDHERYLAYQRAYYLAHRKSLAARATMRNRVKRSMQLLWHILPEPPCVESPRTE